LVQASPTKNALEDDKEPKKRNGKELEVEHRRKRARNAKTNPRALIGPLSASHQSSASVTNHRLPGALL
jgi:hypothetical protein